MEPFSAGMLVGSIIASAVFLIVAWIRDGY
jgi:uncharacterized protein (DUF2062 family)